MSKLISRLGIFIVGIPVILGVIWLPFFNHLCLNLLIVAVTFLCANEIHNMAKAKFSLFPQFFMTSLPTLFSVVVALCCIMDLSHIFISYTFVLLLMIIATFSVFHRSDEIGTENFKTLFLETAIGVFTLIYPTVFLSFIQLMTQLNSHQEVISFFVLLVFATDSTAWLLGMLFGKNNRGVVAVSPNKSIAGFWGGYLGPILVAVLIYHLWKDRLGLELYQLIILAVITATTSIVGDLFASLLKRCCSCKDSGHIIPGRGGMLDSVDSIAFSAPAFFFGMMFFQGKFL